MKKKVICEDCKKEFEEDEVFGYAEEGDEEWAYLCEDCAKKPNPQQK